jgi:hypothetical protein
MEIPKKHGDHYYFNYKKGMDFHYVKYRINEKNTYRVKPPQGCTDVYDRLPFPYDAVSI